MSDKKTFNRDWLCILIFLAVTTLTFSPFIFSDKILLSSDQIATGEVKQYMTDGLFRHGQIPTWHGSRLGGMPSIDATFSDALYPLTATLRPFFPWYRLYGFTMVLHVFLAGVFFYLMMRRSFGAVWLASFAGALFFMLSPQFVSHVYPGHDGKMCVIAWLPFVIWRLRSLQYMPSLRNAALMAVGLAMVVLTSHVQMSYFVCMGIFLYWATDVVKAIVDKEEKRLIAGKVVLFWVAVFMGLGISFAQLFPSYMYVREAFSVRGIDRGFEFAASWGLGWAEFFSLWVHEFGNALEYYWGQNHFKLNTEYTGAMPILLTFLALASKPKSVWRIFWAGIAVLALLFSLGKNTPFFTIAYHLVPGVHRFRAPAMMMFWFSFATILMSAFFIKDVLGRRFEIYGDQLKKWTTGLLAALGGITLIAALSSSESFVTSFAASMMGDGNAVQVFKVNFSKNFVPNLWLWWFFSAVALGMLVAVINGKIKGVTLVYALIVMGTADMIKVNSQFIKVESPRKYFFYDKGLASGDSTLAELKREFDKAPFRTFSVRGTFQQPGNEGAYGLESVSGYHDNELNTYRAFRGDQGDIHYLSDIAEMGRDGQIRLSRARIMDNTPFLDLGDVRYILYGAGGGAIGKLLNPTSLGRLSYAADYIVMVEDSIAPALLSRAYDYRTTVALVEEPELPFTKARKGRQAGSGDELTEGNDNRDQQVNTDDNAVDDTDGLRSPATDIAKILAVEWKKYTPNVRVAAITMPADGFLRLSEVYYPGWRISVNGNLAKYYRSDLTWMAIPLKAGSYEVKMEPKSLYLDMSLMVSAVFTLLAVAILALAYVRGRKTAKDKAAA